MADLINNYWTQFLKVSIRYIIIDFSSPNNSLRHSCLSNYFADLDPIEYDLFTLSAKKWHWRARMSAIYFSQTIPRNKQYSILLTSSVLNIAELIGIRPDLASCRKIVYFHENQLVYPVQEIKERDCQYGLNQIMSW